MAEGGVSENGQWSESNKGTPQGAVVSPLIANVYLHYLFDLWADVWRRKAARAMSSSFATLTMLCWVFSSGLMLCGFLESSRNG